MIVRSSHIITLPSGNLARDFRWESLGYGRVRVQYNYTDRRRAHQTARKFTVEFLNGKVDSIQARSTNGGRVEYFKTSSIINELLEMLTELNEVVHDVEEYHESSKDEETETEQDSTASTTRDTSTASTASTAKDTSTASTTSTAKDTKDTRDTSTLKLLRGVVMINVVITLVTLGILWCNL